MIQTLRWIPQPASQRSCLICATAVPINSRAYPLLLAWLGMLEVAGADRYMTLDPHAGQVQGFFKFPAMF